MVLDRLAHRKAVRHRDVKGVERKGVKARDAARKGVKARDAARKDVKVRDAKVRDAARKDVKVRDVERRDVKVRDGELKVVEPKVVLACRVCRSFLPWMPIKMAKSQQPRLPMQLLR
jgi:hypothetical protein